MNCQDFQDMLTAYIDGELPDSQRQKLQEHLDGCETCRSQLQAYRRLKEDLDMIQFKEPTDAELQRYWQGIYNRLERGVGWMLFSAGAIVLLCYGVFKLLETLIRNPTVEWILKVGAVAMVFGLVVLFVSILRERLSLRKVDKYSREVEK